MKRKLLIIMAWSFIILISCNKTEIESEDIQEQVNHLKTKTSTSALVTYNVTPSTVIDSAFWATVKNSLLTNPVEVVFANGTYARTTGIVLYGIGNVNNQLTLRCPTEAGAVFTGTNVSNMLSLGYCKNIKIWGLKITGGGMTNYGSGVSLSQNITYEKCHFIDLTNVHYAAINVSGTTTNNILVKNCVFTRVGTSAAAHMIYCANGVKRLKLIGNTFTDCPGDFVRFRNNSDMGVVFNNTFVSTGTYLNSNPPMITASVFNDVNPGDEFLGTKFLIAKNTISYATVGSQGSRWTFAFHSSGFNPPGRTYLISAADAATLHTGTITQKRNIMLNNIGVDGTLFYFGQNTITNVEYNVVYRCFNGYGSSGPWTGHAYISNFVNPNGLASMTESQAIDFYN